MMKINFINNRSNQVKIVQCSLLAGVILMTSCSSQKNETSSDVSNSEIISTTVTTPSVSYDEPVEYNLNWTNEDTEEFAKYYDDKMDGEKTLKTYIRQFGFDEFICNLFTEFVNDKYNKNYRSVPISEANYLYDYLISKGESYMFHGNYENFCDNFLNTNRAYQGLFCNKLLLSYLIQNNIPLGERISAENCKSLMGDEIFQNYGTYKYFYANPQAGNYEYSYKYTNVELYQVLVMNNARLSDLCNDERIADFNLLSTSEEYSEKARKAVIIYNDFLKQYYGPNAIQIGQVPTREQYIAIFGEEPLDLSYIPGAVISQTPVKGNAQVRVDYDNYNVYYTPTYGYDDESTGRGRRM